MVIAIIAILASMLLPALTAARETALSSSCASNQRQIILAVISYTLDNDEWFPNTNKIPAKKLHDSDIYYQLVPYLQVDPVKYRYNYSWKAHQVWACPADSFRAENWLTSNYARAGGSSYGSYGFNIYMSHGWDTPVMGRMTQFSQQSRYIFAGDGRMNNYGGFAMVGLALNCFPINLTYQEFVNNGLDFRHRRKSIQVWLDGHTDSRSIADLRGKYGYMYIGYDRYR